MMVAVLAATKFQECTKFASLVRECNDPSMLLRGKLLHSEIVDRGLGSKTFLANLLVQMYAACGSLQDAKQVFDTIAKRNIFSYTIMITALVQAGRRRDALHLFHCVDLEGLAHDEVALINAIAACERLSEGKAIHRRLQASGAVSLFAANSVLGFFARIGSIEDAVCLFQKMKERDIVSWTSLISAYAHNGHSLDALDLYDRALREIQPNEVTYVVLLGACSDLGDLNRGLQLHSKILSSSTDCIDSVIVANALLSMYSRCGSLRRARKFFEAIPAMKTRVSWTVMVAAYVGQGFASKAKEMFHTMVVEGELPDEVTFVSLLHACSHGGELDDAVHYFMSMVGDYLLSGRNEHCCRCVLDLLGRLGWLEQVERFLVEDSTLGSSVVAWKTFLGACKVHSSPSMQARSSSQRLMELHPSDATSYVMLSNLYAHK